MSPPRDAWDRFRFIKNKALSIAAGVWIVAATFAPADEIEYQKIREAISKLAPPVGEWKAVWTFRDKEGAKEDLGTQSTYSRRSPAETCERMDLEIVFACVR